jgi:flagellar motility protein MotE (MotC chaperone)
VIVTRQRRRRLHLGRYLVPLLALGALGFVLSFPPTQRAIANGPLKPAWTVGANAGGVLVRPFTFAAQQETINERNRKIQDLDGQLEAQRRAKADADARVQQLQQQVSALANQPHPAPVPAARVTVAPSALAGAPGAAGAAQHPASDDEKRLAATWAAMEPEKAAAIVQRLPDDEVTRVLAQMDADAAGAIMNALPASVAARISRAVAQIPPAANR